MSVIDVLITCYNKADYIQNVVEKAALIPYIRSIIVFDDASIDGSSDVLRSLDHISNLRVIYGRENVGVSRARNYLICQSDAEYLCFIDGDDEVIPDEKGEQLKALISNKNFIFSYSDYNRNTSKYHKTVIAGTYSYSRLQKENFIPFSSVIVRKKVTFKSCHHEDYLCWLDSLKNEPSDAVYYHVGVTYTYNDHGKGLSQNLLSGVIATYKVKRMSGIPLFSSLMSTYTYVFSAVKKRLSLQRRT